MLVWSFIFAATNTEFVQKFEQNLRRLLRTVLPDVVNIYCLIVFPEAKDFLFFTLFITD